MLKPFTFGVYNYVSEGYGEGFTRGHSALWLEGGFLVNKHLDSWLVTQHTNLIGYDKPSEQVRALSGDAHRLVPTCISLPQKTTGLGDSNLPISIALKHNIMHC